MTRRSLLKFTVPLALLKSTFAIYAFLLTSPAAAAPNDVRRPPITGIAGVQIGTTNMKDASKFFSSFATQAGVPANSSAWKDPQIFTCGSQTISL